jgi:hypothetical protein
MPVPPAVFWDNGLEPNGDGGRVKLILAEVAADAPGDGIDGPLHQYRRAGGAGAVLGQDRVHAAGPAGRKAMASISIFAFSNKPATCTAVLVGGSFGKNSPRMRENTA